LAIIAPVLIGFVLGGEALAGMLGRIHCCEYVWP
jgi:Na+/H+-translocating membrane pyrophosphatase